MLDFIKRKRNLIIGIAIVIVIAGVVAARIKSNGAIPTVGLETGDIIRTVKISGKVVPKESVDLGFEITGTVQSVSKMVGQTVRQGDPLVRIDSSSILAEIRRAEAELALAEANLNKLDGAGDYEAQITNAKRSIIQTISDTYAAADDAIYNKTDQLFLNPRSGRPEISYAFRGYFDLRDSINSQRATMGEKLDNWKKLVNALSVTNYTQEDLVRSEKYLGEISTYVADVSRAVNLFEENDSTPQTMIDKYKADAVQARDNLNRSAQNLISAKDRLENLLLDVPVQAARVEAARASLLNLRSQLSKATLTSPTNGIISRQDAKIGQVVSPSVSIVSIMSDDLTVEAFVPEVLIPGVEIGNKATITLDALGRREIFEAMVIMIDPAETIRDGVSTYKIKVALSDPEGRARSGMTANVEIETFRKESVMTILERAVVRNNGEAFVYVLDNDNKTRKAVVELGERDSRGKVELVSGLTSRDRILINPPENNK